VAAAAGDLARGLDAGPDRGRRAGDRVPGRAQPPAAAGRQRRPAQPGRRAVRAVRRRRRAAGRGGSRSGGGLGGSGRDERGGGHRDAHSDAHPGVAVSVPPAGPTEATAPRPRPRAPTAVVVLAVLAVGYTLWATQDLILPMLLAMFFALVGNPIIRLLQRIRIPRFLAALA